MEQDFDNTLQSVEFDPPLASNLFSQERMFVDPDELPSFPNGNLGMKPTTIDCLPEFNPSTGVKIDMSKMEIPDMPALPAFGHSRSMSQIPTSSSQSNLESVSGILISNGSLTSMDQLPQIPETLPDGQESGFDSHIEPKSSGFLPEFVSIKGTSIANNPDGLPLRKCKICDRAVDFDGFVCNGFYLHKSCTTCQKCGQQITPPRCALFKDGIFCVSCVKQPEQRHCAVCDMLLDGCEKEISIQEADICIHANCLSCRNCSRPLIKGQHVILGKSIYCRRCFPDMKERICHVCKQLVVGDFVKCHKKFYHPDHFMCCVCKKELHGNNYIIHHNNLYCYEHGEFFITHCKYCKLPLYSTDEPTVVFSKSTYHSACLVCRVCGTHLLPNTAMAIHGRPHCSVCYGLKNTEIKTSCAVKKHRHYPYTTIERRNRYSQQGIKVTQPEYHHANIKWLESAVPEKVRQREKFVDDF